MSQLTSYSDVSMGDGGEGMTDSQLDREAEELLASDPSNDRLEDGLATSAMHASSCVVNKDQVCASPCPRLAARPSSHMALSLTQITGRQNGRKWRQGV